YRAVRGRFVDPGLLRAGQAATVLPICALTLATGGDDIPVLALSMLAFAYAARSPGDGRSGVGGGLARQSGTAGDGPSGIGGGLARQSGTAGDGPSGVGGDLARQSGTAFR